jgi:hypothetical protein
MAFPYTPRYFVRFRHSDTGLSPTFTYYKRADTLVSITAPSIYQVGGGTYYFEHQFLTQDDPDIVFEIDGGPSIPTEEVRYISDTISPRDNFLDQPVSVALAAFDLTSIRDGMEAVLADMTGLKDDIARILGLTKENSVMDQTAFVEGTSNLRQARVQIFASSADAMARSNPIAIYQITATWSGQNIQTFTQTRIDV